MKNRQTDEQCDHIIIVYLQFFNRLAHGYIDRIIFLPHSRVADLLVQDNALAGGAILQEGNGAVVREHKDPVSRRESKLQEPRTSIPPLPPKSNTGAANKANLHNHLQARITHIHNLSEFKASFVIIYLIVISIFICFVTLLILYLLQSIYS